MNVSMNDAVLVWCLSAEIGAV